MTAGLLTLETADGPAGRLATLVMPVVGGGRAPAAARLPAGP